MVLLASRAGPVPGPAVTTRYAWWSKAVRVLWPGPWQAEALTAIAATVVGGSTILGGESSIARRCGNGDQRIINNGFVLLNLNPVYEDAVFGDLVLLAVGLDQWPRRLARWRRLSDRTRSRFGRGRPFSPAISRRNVWPRQARPLSASRSNYPQLDENAPLVEVELSARGYLTITSRGAELLGRATTRPSAKRRNPVVSPRPRDRHQ